MSDKQTIADLEEDRDRLALECDSIRNQIEEAVAIRADGGDYSDPVWFAKAKAALRIKRRHYNSLLREIADLKKAARQAKAQDEQVTFERLFMRVAKRLLEADMYSLILRETVAETDDSGKGEIT